MKLLESNFSGFKSVEIQTKSIRLVVVTDFGPRIAFWGRPDKENILLWSPGKYFRNKWELVGGHRVWVTRPLADECEETYNVDNQKCEVKQLDSGWMVTAPIDPLNNTKKGIVVKVLDDNKIEVDNFMTNCGDMLYSGGVWALTCTVPNKSTRYGIPLDGDNDKWNYCKIVMFKSWGGHIGGGYADDQFTFVDDMMIINPAGKENKRMMQTDKGIIAMHDKERDILFAIKTTYEREGQYPQACNLASYIGPDNFMVEMETMAPEKTIKPGETIHDIETWVLESSEIPLDSKKLESLFK